jgi:pimeloyl-ACP methyl ester carboxylesterase
MHFTSETTADGVSEQLFVLGDVQGALWVPARATGARPLVLLGHGGGQHKQSRGLVARARRYVTDCGFAVAAIDAPGHGDRPRTAADEQHVTTIRQRRATGEPLGPIVVPYHAELAARAVPEWQETLDALQGLAEIGPAGPVGYWGLSMGTGIGVPLTAAEPRINAAIFGALGHESLTDAAGHVTVPVQFLLQWDDELVGRQSGLALFDAFASTEKTLHANSGTHLQVPRFELDSSARFFVRHLSPAGASPA